MKGIHRIIVQNKRIRYDFEVKRNITILQGDSATGKMTLIDMIQEYMDQGKASMIDLQCDKRCGVIGGSTWQGQLSQFTDSIIFIDEGNDFILSNEFASIIQKTDNYYVIVSREGLPNLPYSVEEIYGIHSSGKYGQVKQCYQTFYHIYNLKNEEREIIPEIVITDGVKVVGNNAFNGCAMLRKLVVPASVETLGESAFLKYVSRVRSGVSVLQENQTSLMS